MKSIHRKSIHRNSINGIRIFMVLLATILLTACGGGGGGGSNGGGTSDTTAPTAMVKGGKAAIGESGPIIITFSEAMDTSSLALSGSVVGDSDGGVWSTTVATDDTLTFTPTTTWPLGADSTLTVDAADPAGNALATLTLALGVYPGTLYYVSATAADDTGDGLSVATAKKTIGAAIAAATAPASVLVAEGAYSVNSHSGVATQIVLVEGINLVGGFKADFSALDTTLYISSVTDISTEVEGTHNRIMEANSGVTAATRIDGFTLNAGGGDNSSAIFLQGSAGLTVNNNIINSGAVSNGGYGIRDATSANGSVISNNTINSASGSVIYGISSNSMEPNLVVNNTINGGSSSSQDIGIAARQNAVIAGNTINGGTSGTIKGIFTDVNAAATVSGNTINGGTTTGSYQGMRISGPATVEANTITAGGGPSSYGIITSQPEATGAIRNNTINGGAGGSSYGITTMASSAPNIHNNVINGGDGTSASWGVYISGGANPTVRNNTINGGNGPNLSGGIYIWNSTGVIENNIVFTSGSATTQWCVSESATATSNPTSFRNNDLSACSTALYMNYVAGGAGNCGGGQINHDCLTTDVDINDPAKTTGGAAGSAGGNISLAPALADVAGGDYHLTVSTPPEVSSGGLNGLDETLAWLFSTDMDGVTRPASGTLWSIGAFEP